MQYAKNNDNAFNFFPHLTQIAVSKTNILYGNDMSPCFMILLALCQLNSEKACNGLYACKRVKVYRYFLKKIALDNQFSFEKSCLRSPI